MKIWFVMWIAVLVVVTQVCLRYNDSCEHYELSTFSLYFPRRNRCCEFCGLTIWVMLNLWYRSCNCLLVLSFRVSSLLNVI